MNLKKNITPRFIVILVDSVIASISVFVAFLLRFNFNIPNNEINGLIYSFVIIVSLRFLSLFYKQRYKNLARYTSAQDVKNIFVVTLLTSFVFSGVNLISYYFFNNTFIIPFSIIIIEFLFSLFCFTFYRIGARILNDNASIDKHLRKENIIIYGAKSDALHTINVLKKEQPNLKVIALLTENNDKVGKKIRNIPIIRHTELETLLKKYQIKSLINSLSDISSEQLNHITNLCLKQKVEVLTIPRAKDWLNKELRFNQIKKIKIEDLLERKEISLNKTQIGQRLKNKTILITGAAGSIGSELCRQIAFFNPKKLLLLDQAESDLHELMINLNDALPSLKKESIICDITNKKRLSKIFNRFDIQVVFHAAAYKHVPLMEENVFEAVNTNVFGSKTLIDLSTKNNIEHFVLISTDKAVNPSSVMGATKRLSEIYIQAIKSKYKTNFTTTRFGNVLDSKGSVIPRFRSQIEKLKPLTITHREITRFFMTIPEACNLVLEAYVGKSGEIYVFDMGSPIKIYELAKKMIFLSGLTLDKDISIKTIGLRPGEKLYEELSYEAENNIPAHHPKIKISKYLSSHTDSFFEELNFLETHLHDLSSKEIVQKLKHLIPEYKSKHSVYQHLD